MSGYTIGEIVVWLVLAAGLGFALGWVARELFVGTKQRAAGVSAVRPPAPPELIEPTAPAEPTAVNQEPAKKAATKSAPAKKAATKSAPAKKAATKSAPAKKAATKSAPAKKTAAKKTAAKKAPAKKAAPPRKPDDT